MINQIVVALFLLFFISCNNTHSEYPEIIVKSNLQEKYDLAKWELYKLNCVIENEKFDSDFLVHMMGDSVERNYHKIRKEYKKQGKDLAEDRLKLRGIFGEDNIADFIECEIQTPKELLDSTHIFKDNEVYITFFPIINKSSAFNFKLKGSLYYSIIFKENQIERVAHGRFEHEYPKEAQQQLEGKFINIIKNRKGKIHPWILKYYQNHKK